MRRKLDAKSSKAIFVGYPKDTKGYKLYDLSSRRFLRSRNVKFHEQRFHDFESNDKEFVPAEIYGSDVNESKPLDEFRQVETIPRQDEEGVELLIINWTYVIRIFVRNLLPAARPAVII